MEQKKFFNVEIGRTTRAGNMQAQHSFVAGVPATKNQYEVHNYYQNQYYGFSVSVSEVKEVLFPEIADKKVTHLCDSDKPNVIKRSRFTHYIYDHNFTAETKEMWFDARKKQTEATDAKKSLIKVLSEEIKSRFNNVVQSVSIDEEKFNVHSGDVRYSADITGTLIMDEIEKSLNEK